MTPTRKEQTYIKPEDYKETPGIVYRPWVKYGSNSGYDYLSEKDDGTYSLVMLKENATAFKTLAAAKEAVQKWCERTRELMAASPWPVHSGKAFNQTRLGAWKFEAIAEDNKPKIATQYKF
jgi:hypothetical protein